MKRTVYFLLLVLFFGVGYIAGQNQEPRTVEKGQDLQTSQQKTDQHLSEKERGSQKETISKPLHTGEEDKLASKALSELLLGAFEKKAEPAKPDNEIMVPPPLPPMSLSVNVPQDRSWERVLTEQEIDEEVMKALRADGVIPLEQIDSFGRTNEALRERLKEEAAQAASLMPSPPEESIDQTKPAAGESAEAPPPLPPPSPTDEIRPG